MSKRNYWTEERFLKEFYKHPLLKNYKILKGFESVEEHIIIEGEVTNHFFAPKEISRITSLAISNSTDKRKFKIHQFNTIHNCSYSYENYEFVKNTEYMKFICSVHGEKSIPQSNHMKGFGCNECSIKGAPKMTNEEFTRRVGELDNGVQVIEELKGYHEGVLCRNNHGLVILSAGNILRGDTGSLRSAVDKTSYMISQFNEKHDNKYSYPNYVYCGNRCKGEIQCPIHGAFTQLTDVHLMGCGCNLCSYESGNRIKGWSRGNFIEAAKGRECILYLINLYNEEENFYKIGITSLGTKERIRKSADVKYKFNIVYEFKSLDAGHVWNLEKEYHREYKEFFYKPLIYFKGETECFNSDLPVEEIIKTLKTLHTSK